MCLGFSEYFDLDVSLVRVVWLLVAVLSGGCGLIAYIIAWIVMPNQPELLPARAGQRRAGP